jgi:ribosomal protein L40E
MSDHEPVYEMLWDCGYCDSKKNLGLTHRFCPACGAPQDPARRYFPPEEEKVAVADHRFVGADKICPSCAAPMSAAASNCGNCGSPMDAAKAAKQVAEGTNLKERRFTDQAPPAPPPAPAGRSPWVYAVAAIFVSAVVCCGVWSFWTKEGVATVTGHAWARTIEVEEFRTVNDGEWRGQVPLGARGERCYEKKRGTDKIPDGEDCKTVNVDNGDGSFKQKKQCTTRYKTVDKMDTWCDFQIDKWTTKTTEKAEGKSNKEEPRWPPVQVTGCAGLGCTREGARAETYTVALEVEGEATSCDVSPELWRGLNEGATVAVTLHVLGGGVDCDSLKAAP